MYTTDIAGLVTRKVLKNLEARKALADFGFAEGEQGRGTCGTVSGVGRAGILESGIGSSGE